MLYCVRLACIATALAGAALILTLQPSGHAGPPPQNSNSSTTQNSNSSTKPATPAAQPPADLSKLTWDIPADADKTVNPVEATEESIAKGKEFFMGKKGNCVFCHGETGSGNKENLPKLRRVPADLSNAERMPKLSDGEIFWKITKGIPWIMPGREKQLTEEERWHVVNFVRTLSKEKPMM
jgi:mono/diheme cytochrome c family protein